MGRYSVRKLFHYDRSGGLHRVAGHHDRLAAHGPQPVGTRYRRLPISEKRFRSDTLFSSTDSATSDRSDRSRYFQRQNAFVPSTIGRVQPAPAVRLGVQPGRGEVGKGQRQSNRRSRSESLRPREEGTLAQRWSSPLHSAQQSQCSVAGSRYVAASLERHQNMQCLLAIRVNSFAP